MVGVPARHRSHLKVDCADHLIESNFGSIVHCVISLNITKADTRINRVEKDTFMVFDVPDKLR